MHSKLNTGLLWVDAALKQQRFESNTFANKHRVIQYNHVTGAAALRAARAEQERGQL